MELNKLERTIKNRFCAVINIKDNNIDAREKIKKHPNQSQEEYEKIINVFDEEWRRNESETSVKKIKETFEFLNCTVDIKQRFNFYFIDRQVRNVINQVVWSTQFDKCDGFALYIHTYGWYGCENNFMTSYKFSYREQFKLKGLLELINRPLFIFNYLFNHSNNQKRIIYALIALIALIVTLIVTLTATFSF